MLKYSVYSSYTLNSVTGSGQHLQSFFLTRRACSTWEHETEYQMTLCVGAPPPQVPQVTPASRDSIAKSILLQMLVFLERKSFA